MSLKISNKKRFSSPSFHIEIVVITLTIMHIHKIIKNKMLNSGDIEPNPGPTNLNFYHVKVERDH